MPATPLQTILAKYRATSQTEREKGSYFEELIHTYFRYKDSHADHALDPNPMKCAATYKWNQKRIEWRCCS